MTYMVIARRNTTIDHVSLRAKTIYVHIDGFCTHSVEVKWVNMTCINLRYLEWFLATTSNLMPLLANNQNVT